MHRCELNHGYRSAEPPRAHHSDNGPRTFCPTGLLCFDPVGMLLCQFVADWKQWPALSNVSSAKFLPIICRLIGKPVSEKPQGTQSVGDPVRLVG